jgi:4-amino-4-deoxy-L-arabinose transferase-like glycosyltransferase
MVRATKTQIVDFKESALWLDILDEIKQWKEQASNETDSIVSTAEEKNPSTANVLMHLGHIAGRKDAVDFFEGILDTLLSIKERENDSKRQ